MTLYMYMYMYNYICMYMYMYIYTCPASISRVLVHVAKCLKIADLQMLEREREMSGRILWYRCGVYPLNLCGRSFAWNVIVGLHSMGNCP